MGRATDTPPDYVLMETPRGKTSVIKINWDFLPTNGCANARFCWMMRYGGQLAFADKLGFD